MQAQTDRFTDTVGLLNALGRLGGKGKKVKWTALESGRHRPIMSHGKKPACTPSIIVRNHAFSATLANTLFQEVILGGTLSDASHKEGLPVRRVTGCVIKVEEFKR